MAVATQPTDADVPAFLDAIPDARRRDDAIALSALMERVTGERPVLWGPSIVGFGSFWYETRTDAYELLVLGFAPRKAALTLYGVYDETLPVEPLLDRLGPHSLSKACLYIKRLDAVDSAVLEHLVRAAWERRLPPRSRQD